MARRRIIEGRWSCASCDTRDILGRHTVCPSCGSPREQGEMSFDFGARTASGGVVAPTVTDASLLARAAAGADWLCPSCDAGNPGDEDTCEKCGAERTPDARQAPTGELPGRDAPRRLSKSERKRQRKLAAQVSSLPAPLRGLARAWVALTGSLASAVAGCAASLGGMCGVYAWTQREVEVSARVEDRTWIRESHVERLRPRDVEGWRDRLPPPAGIPGGTAPLSEGLGTLYGCDTRKCWPRPPDGGTTARVSGVTWARVVTTRVMSRSPRTGWDEQVPSARGSMPSGGRGGTEGHDDLSCSTREREPERCRTVSRQEACGTDERCRVVDQGNGFAEEICEDVTRYCTVQEEECDPAVNDDWCSWTELSWVPGRTLVAEGADDRPRWPTYTLAYDEAESRSEQYTLHLIPLAGAMATELALAGPEALDDFDPGDWVTATGVARPIPAALIPRDFDRVDCGDGVPFDALATRDWCVYQRWGWEPDGTRRAERHEGAPEWPEDGLAPDGRARREERVEVRLAWSRGSSLGCGTPKTGGMVVPHPASDWDRWPVGREVPVVVDADAGFVAWPEPR